MRDAGEHKKRGEPKLPSVRHRLDSGLVLEVLSSGQVAAAPKRTVCVVVYDDQRQVAHGQVARTNIADEREPVSILEVANRNDVTLEARIGARNRGQSEGPVRRIHV